MTVYADIPVNADAIIRNETNAGARRTLAASSEHTVTVDGVRAGFTDSRGGLDRATGATFATTRRAGPAELNSTRRPSSVTTATRSPVISVVNRDLRRAHFGMNSFFSGTTCENRTFSPFHPLEGDCVNHGTTSKNVGRIFTRFRRVRALECPHSIETTGSRCRV
jgi:hypothetical protein